MVTGLRNPAGARLRWYRPATPSAPAIPARCRKARLLAVRRCRPGSRLGKPCSPGPDVVGDGEADIVPEHDLHLNPAGPGVAGHVAHGLPERCDQLVGHLGGHARVDRSVEQDAGPETEWTDGL